MKALFLFIHFALSVSQDSLLLLFGPKTPAKLRESLKAFHSVTFTSFVEPSQIDSSESYSLIIDLTLDPSFFPQIDTIAASFQAPCLSISKPLTFEESFYRFSAFPSITLEAEALINIIKYLSWREFTVFLSNSIENLLTLDLLRKNFSSFQIKSCVYDSNIPEDKLDSLVKRFIKITGDHNLLVLDHGKSLDMLVKILVKRKISKYGKYFLFGPSSLGSVNIDGSVILSYEIGLNFTSIEDFYLEVFSILLKKFESSSQEDLDKRCPKHVCFPNYQILNQRNNQTHIVGSLRSSVMVTKEIIFPGNNPNKNSPFTKTQIPVMIANGTREPNDIGNSEVTSRFFYGALYAVDQANTELEAQNFEFKLIPTDCGNAIFNATWTVGCLSSFATTESIAYLTGYWAQSAFSNLIAFKTFNRFLPQVSPDAFTEFLNNKTYFPEFVKISGRFEEFITNSIFVYRFYNWKKIIFLASQEEIFMNYYEVFSKLMKSMGISVINPEQYRYLPVNYSRDDFQQYKHVFQFVKDSRCRIVLIAAKDQGPYYEALYDIGLRKGDVIIGGDTNLYVSLNEKVEEKFLKKRREICNGAILGNHLQYEGQLGKKIEKELREKYGSVVNMCLTYDAFKTISKSVMHLISKGEDYEDPQLLMSVIRNLRFVGCSGEVYFIPGENSRDKGWLGISQIIIDSETGQMDMLQISALNKFSVIVTRQINDHVWATGEKTIPTNFREIQVCVYKTEPQISTYGKMTLHAVSLIFLLLVVISAVFSFKKYNHPVTPFTESVHISHCDFIHNLFLITEIFQILSLEPSDGLFTKSTKALNLNLGLDLISAFDLKFDDFWDFYSVLLVLVGSWTILILFSVVIKKEALQKYEIFYFLKFLSETILPIIGQICFIPLSLMLLSIYKCEEGISDNLFESFIYRDCTSYCYTGKHRLVVIVSSFIMILFFTLSSSLRAYWETIHWDQHIQTNVSYLSFLTVFQFVLVLARVNFEKTNKIVQGFLLFGLLGFFAFFTARMKPYNYEKSNVFQITILSLGCWNMLVTSLYLIYPFEIIFKFVLFLGMVFIIGLGYFVASKYPSRFISDNNLAVLILIKFQFSTNFDKTIKKNSFYKDLQKKISPENYELALK